MASNGPLLGRDRELDELGASYRSVAGAAPTSCGLPRTVLLTGVAGIGKSTIVAAFAAELEVFLAKRSEIVPRGGMPDATRPAKGDLGNSCTTIGA